MKTSAAQPLLIRIIPVFLIVKIVPYGDYRTSQSPSPTLRNQNPAAGGLNYDPNMEMGLHLSAGPRSDLFAAMENADRATGPDPMRVPSERCMG